MNKCRLNKQQKGYKKISGDIFQQDINSDLKKQQNGKIIPRLEANGKITPLLEAKGKLQGEWTVYILPNKEWALKKF